MDFMHFLLTRIKDSLPIKDRECKISIGDIFLQQGNSINETQFIATSRCLDIQAYCENGICNFEYKNTICKAIHGNLHNEIRSNRDFKRLIDSIRFEGYNTSYPVLCNCDGYLIDGNHRCGACLYFKIEEFNSKFSIPGRIVHKDFNTIVSSGISTDLITNVINQFVKVQEWLIESGNTFALVASGFPNLSACNDFIKRVSFLCTILKIHRTRTSILIQFSLAEPMYKCYQNHLISTKCIQLERLLEKLYPSACLKVSKSCIEGRNIINDFQ